MFEIDSIKLMLHHGMERTLSNVRYAPNLKRNLLSLGVLDSMRFAIKVQNGILKILEVTIVVMKRVRKNGL